MDTQTAPHKKPGPRPKGLKKEQVLLPPALAEWAKDLPSGLSPLLRRLLEEEYERQQATHRVS